MMTLAEFNRVIDCYGADSGIWPAEVKEDCLSFVNSSAAARAVLSQQQELEQLLDHIRVPTFPDLVMRVANQNLPARRATIVDAILRWLLPAGQVGRQFWRPAMVACLPLVFGFLLGNIFSFGISDSSDGFEYWDDELYMLSLNDYTENLF